MHVLAPREVVVRRVSERSISAMVDCYLSLNNNLLKSCHSPGSQSSQVLIRTSPFARCPSLEILVHSMVVGPRK
jgi:hypothetical protein